jgi:hypothetical protein
VRFGDVLEWRPRPTPGCSAIEEEEEEEEEEDVGWRLTGLEFHCNTDSFLFFLLY